MRETRGFSLAGAFVLMASFGFTAFALFMPCTDVFKVIVRAAITVVTLSVVTTLISGLVPISYFSTILNYCNSYTYSCYNCTTGTPALTCVIYSKNSSGDCWYYSNTRDIACETFHGQLSESVALDLFGCTALVMTIVLSSVALWHAIRHPNTEQLQPDFVYQSPSSVPPTEIVVGQDMTQISGDNHPQVHSPPSQPQAQSSQPNVIIQPVIIQPIVMGQQPLGMPMMHPMPYDVSSYQHGAPPMDPMMYQQQYVPPTNPEIHK